VYKLIELITRRALGLSRCPRHKAKPAGRALIGRTRLSENFLRWKQHTRSDPIRALILEPNRARADAGSVWKMAELSAVRQELVSIFIRDVFFPASHTETSGQCELD